MVQELGSFVEGSKNPTTHTSTPKSMEEVDVEVMQVNKTTKLFQTMIIVSMSMGNLTLEVNNLKNSLATREKEKVVLQEELNKERDFQKGYKHNVEIWKKNMVEAEQKKKCSLKNCRMRMKSSRVANMAKVIG